MLLSQLPTSWLLSGLWTMAEHNVSKSLAMPIWDADPLLQKCKAKSCKSGSRVYTLTCCLVQAFVLLYVYC